MQCWSPTFPFRAPLTIEDMVPDAGETASVIDSIFQPYLRDNSPEINSYGSHVYPEQLLHQFTGAHQCLNSLQKYTRQFVGSDKPTSASVYSKSQMWRVSRDLVSHWQTSSIKALANTGSVANSLFSWSSEESYVRARREILSRGTEQTHQTEVLPRKVSFVTELNHVVEIESSKFIQQRIQVIKAHHTEQVSQIINERKKKDHERHLQRLKLKEEAYEHALQEAIATQKHHRSSGLLGVFGSSSRSLSKSFVLDISDTNTLPYPSPAVSSRLSAESRSRNGRGIFSGGFLRSRKKTAVDEKSMSDSDATANGDLNPEVIDPVRKPSEETSGGQSKAEVVDESHSNNYGLSDDADDFGDFEEQPSIHQDLDNHVVAQVSESPKPDGFANVDLLDATTTLQILSIPVMTSSPLRSSSLAPDDLLD